jgi:hypothetical protein
MHHHMSGFIEMGLSFMQEVDSARVERLEQTIAKWKESQNYPRKLKKKVRKELRLDFAIYSWKPYGDLLDTFGDK